MPEVGLYDDPSVYDILHERGTAEEVDGLERMFHVWAGGGSARVRGGAPRTRGTRGTWFEPACGTGRYLRLAARRGYRVLGVDRAPAMIAYARARVARLGVAGRADLRVADMTTLPRDWRGRADFAFNLINTIRHLPTDAAVLAHLRSVASSLRPGGVYCVGLTLTSYGMEFPSEDVWEGRRGACRVKQVVGYIPPIGEKAERARAEQAICHLMITRGRGSETTEHRDSRFVLRTYSRRQWEGLLARAPLKVKAVVDEKGAELTLSPSGYGVWVLGKKGRRD
ncbi:MAG: class I SAM-dependent methyltransferase [Phycisphaerales bacterium]